MRVLVIPADVTGCGQFRMILPAQALQRQGYEGEISLMLPHQREIRVDTNGVHVRDVHLPEGTDVVVLQRVTHPLLAQCVPLIRAKGIAVVIDIDDDLSAVHPRNPVYGSIHPSGAGKTGPGGMPNHSWTYLADACREATLVTVSTPALLTVYAAHGRGRVLENRLPQPYFEQKHEDSGVLGWPAALSTHPDDPSVVGGAVARLVGEGRSFRIVGEPTGTGAAFGLPDDPPGESGIDVHEWPAAVARLGVGIAPLADTKFNRSKSALKPLEMSALGVPWVGSPRAEYARLHARGAGVLADTPRRWYRELKRLLDSEAGRRELSEAGRAAVQDLTIDRDAWRWWEAWSDALAAERGGRAAA